MTQLINEEIHIILHDSNFLLNTNQGCLGNENSYGNGNRIYPMGIPTGFPMGILKFLMDSHGNSHRFSHVFLCNTYEKMHNIPLEHFEYKLHRIIHTPESKFKFRGPLTYVSTMFYNIVVA